MSDAAADSSARGALSPRTVAYVAAMFSPDQRDRAARLLAERCGVNLSGLAGLDPVALERWRFAALKLSDGRFDRLERAVQLAETDWRDLLVAAGFAHHVRAHEAWTPEPRPR